MLRKFGEGSILKGKSAKKKSEWTEKDQEELLAELEEDEKDGEDN